MTVDVVNSQNQKVGSIELSDAVFGGRVKTDLIHASVIRANAAERRGTHATKNRALVSGSGKKPWRQKGTGRARVGETRNPLWRKGGTVFGPQPRSYAFTAPKKVELGGLQALQFGRQARRGNLHEARPHRRRFVRDLVEHVVDLLDLQLGEQIGELPGQLGTGHRGLQT